MLRPENDFVGSFFQLKDSVPGLLVTLGAVIVVGFQLAATNVKEWLLTV